MSKTNPYLNQSVDDLVARSQALGIEQDAIRAERKALNEEIGARLEAKHASLSSAGDAKVEGAALNTSASSA